MFGLNWVQLPQSSKTLAFRTGALVALEVLMYVAFYGYGMMDAKHSHVAAQVFSIFSWLLAATYAGAVLLCCRPLPRKKTYVYLVALWTLGFALVAISYQFGADVIRNHNVAVIFGVVSMIWGIVIGLTTLSLYLELRDQ